jgi:hypothetical protein
MNDMREEVVKLQKKKSYHLKEARRHNDELRRVSGKLDILELQRRAKERTTYSHRYTKRIEE